MAQYRRVHYLVKKGIQLKFLSWIVGSLLIVTVVTGVGVYYSLVASAIREFSETRVAEKLKIAQRIVQYEQARQGSTLKQVFPEARLLGQHEQESLVHMIRETNRRLIPQLLILLGLIGVLSIFISHKVAGPVFRLERSIREMAAGNFALNFTLRKGDELAEMAHELDELVRSMRGRIERLQGEVAQLAATTQELQGRNALPPDVAQRLHERVKRLRDELAQFRFQ